MVNIADPAARDKSQAALWAMMLGNIAIGLGAMAPAAMMNTLVRDFALPPQTIGHLISWAAIIMCIGAPGFAIFTNRWDRRKLLAGTMALYVVGHIASLFMTSFAGLMIVRLLMISSAAIFTPQAAAVIALISPPEKRAAATAHVFIGWSIATALGMPAMAAAADLVGWQPVMAMIALFSLIAGLGVWFTLKPGLRVAQLNLQDWLSLPRHPAIMALIAVTVLTSAGQFMLYPYLAAELKRITMAPETQIATLLAAFGLSGLAGNRVAARWVGRLGPARINQVSIGMIMLALLLWAPLVTGQATAAICILLWGCGFASCNPMQQVRLGAAGPTLASASIALNTSGIYLGQWIGAAGGGALLAGQDYWAYPGGRKAG
jgi:MFS transporter, DHA1 family, inner membrane transport protein